MDKQVEIVLVEKKNSSFVVCLQQDILNWKDPFKYHTLCIPRLQASNATFVFIHQIQHLLQFSLSLYCLLSPHHRFWRLAQ